ncbi:MAG TPA: hypothetical protein VIW24_23820, partial [Aldersonia sp.]
GDHNWALRDQLRQRVSDITNAIEQFPVPVYGSPPEAVTTFSDAFNKAPLLGVVGTAYFTEGPVLALLAGSIGVVLWLAQPSAEVVRQSMANWTRGKLGGGEQR